MLSKNKVDNNKNIADPYMAYKQWCNLRMFCSRWINCKTLLLRRNGITVYGQILPVYEWPNFSDGIRRWQSITIVNSWPKGISFYFPDRTLHLSLYHYFPLFFVTWKSSSDFPFQWITCSLTTITFLRPELFRFLEVDKAHIRLVHISLFSKLLQSFTFATIKSSQNIQRKKVFGNGY